MNELEIYATYNGERFPVKIGEEYEFSNFENFEDAKPFRLRAVMNAEHAFVTSFDYRYKYIRPIQPEEVKPLTVDELYRICGKNGYEVTASDSGETLFGVINGCDGDYFVYVCDGIFRLQGITHFRKAYSQDEWKPISEIERE